MKLRDALFVADSMPSGEAEDLLIAVVALTVSEKRMLLAYLDKLLADIEFEEAKEKHSTAAAVVKMKKKQYGVGE